MKAAVTDARGGFQKGPVGQRRTGPDVGHLEGVGGRDGRRCVACLQGRRRCVQRLEGRGLEDAAGHLSAPCTDGKPENPGCTVAAGVTPEAGLEPVSGLQAPALSPRGAALPGEGASCISPWSSCGTRTGSRATEQCDLETHPLTCFAALQRSKGTGLVPCPPSPPPLPEAEASSGLI